MQLGKRKSVKLKDLKRGTYSYVYTLQYFIFYIYFKFARLAEFTHFNESTRNSTIRKMLQTTNKCIPGTEEPSVPVARSIYYQFSLSRDKV